MPAAVSAVPSLILPRLLVWMLAALCLAPLSAAALTVVTTIKPISLLVADLAPDAEVRQLLPDTGSPHDYSLRVSDRVALAEAALVVWVGADLEPFLAPVAPADALQWTALPDLDWPPLAPGAKADHAPDEHGHDEHGHDAHGHQQRDAHGHEHHYDRDPHLWLDPDNAEALAAALVARLTVLDPENAEAYRQRLAQWRQRQAAFEARWREALAPLGERGFVVYHDAYRHFVDHFGLNQVRALTVHPEQGVGARTLWELRQLPPGTVDCVFAEPQFGDASVRKLANDLGVAWALVDPLGSTINRQQGYWGFMETFAQGVRDCLAP